MMIELEQSLYNGTGRQNDKSDRGHETALWVISMMYDVSQRGAGKETRPALRPETVTYKTS